MKEKLGCKMKEGKCRMKENETGRNRGTEEGGKLLGRLKRGSLENIKTGERRR